MIQLDITDPNIGKSEAAQYFGWGADDIVYPKKWNFYAFFYEISDEVLNASVNISIIGMDDTWRVSIVRCCSDNNFHISNVMLDTLVDACNLITTIYAIDVDLKQCLVRKKF